MLSATFYITVLFTILFLPQELIVLASHNFYNLLIFNFTAVLADSSNKQHLTFTNLSALSDANYVFCCQF